MTTTIDLKVPPAFWYDHHDSRCLNPDVTVLASTRKHYLVRLDADQLAELRDDADHHVVMAREGGFDIGLPGLVASARATVRAIDRQRPEGWHVEPRPVHTCRQRYVPPVRTAPARPTGTAFVYDRIPYEAMRSSQNRLRELGANTVKATGPRELTAWFDNEADGRRAAQEV